MCVCLFLFQFNEVLLHGHVIILFKAIQPNPYSSISNFGYCIIEQLVPLTAFSDLSIRVCVKMLLSVLPAIIDNDVDGMPPYMQLKGDEIFRLLDLLDKATTKDYVTEGYAEFTLSELLSCLVVLAKSSSNSLALYDSGIVKLLFKIFEFHHYNIQKLCLEVIISLLQFDSICTRVFTSNLNLLYLLKYLHQSPCTTISFLAENALGHCKWNIDAENG